MRFLQFIAVTWLTLVCALAPAHAEKRVALVIGNDRYVNLPAHEQLQKAVNDARAVGVSLMSIGFDLISGENLDRRAMVGRINNLVQRVGPGDTAFFFFSGHGVAIDGVNYVLPADVPDVAAGQETSLKAEALGEPYIISELTGRGVRVAVVVLDACRTNPFGRSGGRGIGGAKGLAPPPQVQGVFSLYAASSGQEALDRLADGDPNPNSVFTRVLAPALTKPGLDLATLALEVREEVAQVARTAGYVQRPAYYDETIGGRVYLNGTPQPGAQAASATVPDAAPVWEAVKNTRNIAALDDFIQRFGDVPIYGPLARARREELAREAAKPADIAPAAKPAEIAPTLQTGLVGHWPLDDTSTDWNTRTTQDVSGNGNAANMVGMSPTTSPIPGKIAGALRFSGKNYLLNSSNPTAISYGTAYTLAFWMKTASANAGGGAMVDYSHTKALQFIGMGYDNGKLIFFNQDDAGRKEVLNANVNVHDGNWHHVAGIRKGSLYNIYVDGSNVASATNAGLGTITPNCLSIGFNCHRGGIFFYNGALDDVRIYNRGLSEQEVAHLRAELR